MCIHLHKKTSIMLLQSGESCYYKNVTCFLGGFNRHVTRCDRIVNDKRHSLKAQKKIE